MEKNGKLCPRRGANWQRFESQQACTLVKC